MNRIKFSIIVPVYNIEDYIGKCINSILNQSYDNFEIIAVNDGSTDNSLKKLKSFNDKRLVIKTKTNGGLSDARNYGLQFVSGDYIWFVDGDDYIDNNSLSLLYDNICVNDSDIVFMNYIEKYPSFEKKMYIKPSFYTSDYNILLNGSAWSKIFKKEFFINNNFKFRKGLLFEDLEVIPFIISKSNKISFVDSFLYYYVQRSNSIMHCNKVFKDNRDNRFDSFDSLMKRFSNDGTFSDYEEQLTFLFIRHLVFGYSQELFNYSKCIYLPRLDRINNLLYSFKYIKNNKYLSYMSFFHKVYYFLFINKFYFLCSIIIRIKKYR